MQTASTNPRLFTFLGGSAGPWNISEIRSVKGATLALAAKVLVVHGPLSALPPDTQWALRGVTSNIRYTTRTEYASLTSIQANLDRPDATCAALIPIKKTAAWWELTQDERRAIFENDSRHTAIGLKYLPAIARRLHHCRDLGESEPFDFLTWFEFAPEHEPAFEALLDELRATTEWQFVEREVDIRLCR